MNIFLDTTQSQFVACLFDEKFKVKNKFIKETVYKVEEIPKFFNNLLMEEKTDINDVKNFYINIGPGSFTGSRISLIYVRTIAQITGAKIWTTNSFKLLKSNESKLFISANKNHSYAISQNDIENIEKTTLTEKSTEEQSIDYLSLLNSFEDNLHFFDNQELLSIKPEYGSTPQIGSKK